MTIPLKNIDAVPVAPLAGKIVIDTNNYYPQRDGQIAELDDESTTTAGCCSAPAGVEGREGLQPHRSADLTTANSPSGTPAAARSPSSGDDAEARATSRR